MNVDLSQFIRFKAAQQQSPKKRKRIINHCVRKVKHDNLERANYAINRMKKKENVDHPERLVAYNCKYCQGYHIGHDKFLKL